LGVNFSLEASRKGGVEKGRGGEEEIKQDGGRGGQARSCSAAETGKAQKFPTGVEHFTQVSPEYVKTQRRNRKTGHNPRNTSENRRTYCAFGEKRGSRLIPANLARLSQKKKEGRERQVSRGGMK